MSIDHPAAPAEQGSFAPFACPMGHGSPAGGPDASSPTASSGRRGRRGRGYFVPGIIALVVMAAAGGVVNFAGLDHQSPTKLAGPDVATFLAEGIQTQAGLAAPPNISCPASEAVRAGLRFTCRWHRSDGDRPVYVTETDGRGQFRFSVAAPTN